MHISLLAIYFVYIFSNRKIYRCIGVVWHRAFSKAPNYSIEFESARKREKQLKRHFIIGSCKILMHIYKIWILAFISAIYQYSSRKTSYDTHSIHRSAQGQQIQWAKRHMSHDHRIQLFLTTTTTTTCLAYESTDLKLELHDARNAIKKKENKIFQ